ncbi:hypothetical protein ACO7_180042 [Thiomonas arsenitoxydans]|nr:hypothetical protein ACO7_180042 [Thiomonas arsenitoxydans]
MATPISRDDRRAVSCSGLRPSQLTAPKTYTTRGDITLRTLTLPRRAAGIGPLLPLHFEKSCRPTFDVTGRRRSKAGASLQAALAGGPVDGGAGRHCTGHTTVPIKCSGSMRTTAFMASRRADSVLPPLK